MTQSKIIEELKKEKDKLKKSLDYFYDLSKGFSIDNRKLKSQLQQCQKSKDEIFNDMEFWIVSRIEVNSDEFSDNPLLRSQIQIAFRKFFNYVIKELKQKHNKERK